MKPLSVPLPSSLLCLTLLLAACGSSAPTVVVATDPPLPGPSALPTAPAVPTLILATTTSTQDSGLLDVLIPAFEARTGYVVQTVAVGSGQALQMGQDGNADLLLVHAPASEADFMENGYGTDRRLVMHNDYIIVGPAADPAGIRGLTTLEALAAIASTGSSFASRGDDSGTHKKELSLWQTIAQDPPVLPGYVETGQGMGATLIIASETGAYTLTDRATFLASRDNLALEILVEGDASLLNVYHVIVVNPDRWPGMNLDGATALADFLTSPEGQALIGQFGVEEFGQALFTPDAGKDESGLGQP